MTTVLMAFACMAFISCDKDDDNDLAGGTGSGSLSAGSASLSVNYGFYDVYDEEEGELAWEFAFFNFDPNSTSLPQKVDELFIYFSVPDSIEGIPLGTFYAFGATVCKGVNPTRENEDGDYYSGMSDKMRRKSALIVSKSGDNYTISFEGLPMTNDSSKESVTASFSYTGKLSEMQYYDE